MKILLISVPYSNRLSNESLGIERICTYLKAQNKVVDVLYIHESDDVEKEFSKIDLNYDIFGFSPLHDNIDFVSKLALLIKRSNPFSFVVFGSKYITSYYKDIVLYEKEKEESCFDFLVLGEGEYTMLNIMNCLERNEDIKNYANQNENIATIESIENKKALSIDINELPVPERIYIKNKNSITAYICDSHGCVGSCSFCSSYFYHKWCGRTAKSLFDEVLSIYNNTKSRIFMFTSSSFEDPGDLGKERINKFCDKVIESKISVSFKCYLRAETFDENDIELLRKMKMAGFNQVYVGVESGNDEDLRLYAKRANVNDNKKMLELLNKAGIYGGEFGFIMFNPYSDLKRISSNYYFLADNNPFNMHNFVSKLIVFKGTKIYEMLQKDNMIINKKKSSYNMIEDFHFADKEITDLYRFVEEYITVDSLMDAGFNSSFLMSILHNFSHLPEIEESTEEFLTIISSNETIVKNYFYWLYVKYDISYCKKIYDEFKFNYLDNDKKMQLLYNKLLKKLMKKNIILS